MTIYTFKEIDRLQKTAKLIPTFLQRHINSVFLRIFQGTTACVYENRNESWENRKKIKITWFNQNPLLWFYQSPISCCCICAVQNSHAWILVNIIGLLYMQCITHITAQECILLRVIVGKISNFQKKSAWTTYNQTSIILFTKEK